MKLIHLILRQPLLALGIVAALGASAPSPAAPAQIAGTVSSASTITRVAAIDRQGADVLKTSLPEAQDPFVYEGVFDPATHHFHIDNLLPGRTYDLVFWTTDAAGHQTRWEGAAMDYHRPILPAAPATPEDRKWLEHFVSQMPAFYDQSRVLHMAADHQHATLLVELARTRDFHSDKGGEMIYRVELWYFENLFGGWAKDKNTERVLVRWRGEGKGLLKNWQFLPALGGIAVDQAGRSAVVDIHLPDRPTTANGLAEASN
jgi:hypothetical protein